MLRGRGRAGQRLPAARSNARMASAGGRVPVLAKNSIAARRRAHSPVGDPATSNRSPTCRRWPGTTASAQQRFSPPDERIGTSEISIRGDDERGFGGEAEAGDRRLPQHTPLLKSFARRLEAARIRQRGQKRPQAEVRARLEPFGATKALPAPPRPHRASPVLRSQRYRQPGRDP